MEADLALLEYKINDPNSHVDREESRQLGQQYENLKASLAIAYQTWEAAGVMLEELDREDPDQGGKQSRLSTEPKNGGAAGEN